jgi:hypothetical protein
MGVKHKTAGFGTRHEWPTVQPRRLANRGGIKVLTKSVNENPISVAFGIERNSLMNRGNLADLTAFVAVADQLSFRAAASRLGVTPSALSHSMRQLEIAFVHQSAAFAAI